MKISTLSTEQKLEIINFYLTPHTLNETAAQFNINKYSIKKILQEQGVNLHSKEVRKARIKQAFTEQYGVDNPSKNKSIQEKIKKTSLAKYGTDRPQKAEAIKEKAKNTCLAKYGVVSSAQNKDVQNKIKQTNLERYGCTCSLQNEEVQAKSKQTVLEKYNVDNVMQNDSIKEKVKCTMLQRYGVEYAPQNKEIQEKSKATCQQKYGVDYPAQVPEVRQKAEQTNLERYGYAHPGQVEEFKQKIIESLKSEKARTKAKQTSLLHYGVEHPTQSKIVQDKVNKTKKVNKTFNTSGPEEKYYRYLCKKYGAEEVLRQYKDNRYPFNCDFYIKSEDLFIELNISWTHGGKLFEGNAADLLKLATWKERAKHSNYYKTAIEVWTQRDVQKYKIAKENNLNYKIYYTEAELKLPGD